MKAENKMAEQMLRARLKDIEELSEKAKMVAEAFCREIENYGLEDSGFESDFYERVNTLQSSETTTEDVLSDWKESGLYDALVSMIEQSNKEQK